MLLGYGTETKCQTVKKENRTKKALLARFEFLKEKLKIKIGLL
jgi:hypothetical protein